jgi:ribosomal protein S18 acetylase RimI-like enzyme
MLEIRKARVGDDAALVAIDDATWSPHVTPAPRPAESDRAFFDNGRGPDEFIVAVVDGSVAGYVSLHQWSPLPAHRHVLEINGLAVDPARQGMGIGRRLVEEARREAANRGATKLTLRVLGPNAGARRIYEACGFTVEGVLKGEFLLDGQLVDDVLMACQLPQISGGDRSPGG